VDINWQQNGKISREYSLSENISKLGLGYFFGRTLFQWSLFC